MRQELTKSKAERVADSLERLYIMAKVLHMESVNELDADFRMPILNNFAKRIQGDCLAISKQLDASGYFALEHNDNTEELAGEIWRVMALLVGLDVKLVKEFADNLENEFKKMVV